MSRRSALRASDADREGVAERLRRAAAEGRLLTEELEQRLESTFSARTYGQLEAQIADLPGRRLLAPEHRGPRVLAATLRVTAAALLAVVIAAIVLQIALGVFVGWWVWMAIGWFVLGRRRGRHAYRAACHGSPRGRPVDIRSEHSPARWA